MDTHALLDAPGEVNRRETQPSSTHDAAVQESLESSQKNLPYQTGHMETLLLEMEKKLERRLDVIEAGITALLSRDPAKDNEDQEQVDNSDFPTKEVEPDMDVENLQLSKLDDDTPTTFTLRELWSKLGKITTSKSCGSLRLSEKRKFETKPLQKPYWFIVRPSSALRLSWDFLGLIMIATEVSTTPVQLAFDLQKPWWFVALFWANLMFWTLEIPANFISGYYDRGAEELRPRKIVKRYLQTWFFLDIVVVAVDWADILLQHFDDPGVSMARMGRILRIVKVFRSLRVLRLAKLRRIIESMQDQIQSEHIHIGMNVLKFTILILCVSHIVACAWYGISSTKQGPTWISAMNLTNADFSYKYFTALHWSLTQFTPASVNIVPHNLGERVYSVVVLLFALIVFSSLISSITTAMTQLRQLSTYFDKNISVLRRYLKRHKVPVDLSIRIMRYAEHKVHLQKREIQEKDVSLIRILSRPLHMELVHSTLGPLVTHHPLFQCYNDSDSEALKRVCFDATSSIQLSAGDILFSEATRTDHMIFVKDGELMYTNMTGHAKFRRLSSSETLDSVSDSCILEDCTWCCEAALWTEWVHVGVMRANLDTEVLTIDAAAFAKETSKHHRVMHPVVKYGSGFVQKLNELAERNVYSDFIPKVVQTTFLEELAAEAFDSTRFVPERKPLLRRLATRMVGHKKGAKERPAFEMVEGNSHEKAPNPSEDDSEGSVHI